MELSTLKAVLAQKESDLKQQQERYQQHKAIWEQEKNQLTQSLVNEKQIGQKQAKILAEKDKVHEEQQRVLLNQQEAMRNLEQQLSAKEEQLKTQHDEIKKQKRNAKKRSEKAEELSTQLTQKVSGLSEANEKQARENQQLASKIIQLEKALQEASDREMALKLERNQPKRPPPSTPTTTAAKGGEFGSVFSASPSSSSASPLKPAAKALSYAEQVEAGSKAVQGKIDQKELAALLKWVTEGQLVEVEKLIKKNPSLGLGTGTVTDRSERTFKNVTVLQYAAWALDAEMCELIIPYLGAHNTSIQLKALANEPNGYSTHGASYDFSPLVTKTQTYVDKYASWDDAERMRYWQKEVGGEQRKCPAWLIYAWSEAGYDVAWTRKDPNRKIKREYDKNRLDWWFTENYNSGRGVGSLWAVVRGRKFSPSRGQCNGTYIYNGGTGLGEIAFVDSEFVSLVGKTRCETLQRLMATSDSQLTQSSIGLGKGQ